MKILKGLTSQSEWSLIAAEQDREIRRAHVRMIRQAICDSGARSTEIEPKLL